MAITLAILAILAVGLAGLCVVAYIERDKPAPQDPAEPEPAPDADPFLGPIWTPGDK